MVTPNFKPDVTDYDVENAYLMALCSDLVYRSKRGTSAQIKKWGFTHCRSEAGPRSTEYFVAKNEEAIVVSFRGTEKPKLEKWGLKIDDWMTDVQVNLTPGPLGECHEGFSRALAGIWPDLRDRIKDYQNNGQGIWLTGHSLGGALATLAAAKFCELAIPVRCVYTFGAPRVGDTNFADKLSLKMEGGFFRVVNNNDVVTRIPPRIPVGYRHPSGGLVFITSDGEITHSPNAWKQFVDRIKGRIAERFNGFIRISDGLKDHSITDSYIPALQKEVKATRQREEAN